MRNDVLDAFDDIIGQRLYALHGGPQLHVGADAGSASCTACADGTFSLGGAATCDACGSCDDGDPCTADACDPTLGCTHTPSCSPDMAVAGGGPSGSHGGCTIGGAADQSFAGACLLLAALILLARRRRSIR